jgi:hypothetical protein
MRRSFDDHVEGLPGRLTSTAFKVVSTRRELAHGLDFVTHPSRPRSQRDEASATSAACTREQAFVGQD